MILRNAIACLAAMWAVSVLADDALTKAVDPYDQADQKVKFFKTAGNSGELDQKKFLADQKAGGGLILPFEKWETAAAFDKNKNGTLDWFEFEAYRQAMRAAVLAGFDKNKDGKLTGDERAAALKALTDGKVVIKPGAEAPRAFPPTAASQPTRISLEASGLSEETIRHIKEKIPNAVAVDTRDTKDTDIRIVYCGDGQMRILDMRSEEEQAWLAAIVRRNEERRERMLASPLREFLLRNFDADGDGKLSDKDGEGAMCDAFLFELQTTMMNWQSVMFDKDTTNDERHEIERTLNERIELAAGKRIHGGGPPSPEKEDAFQKQIEIGMARYIERIEKQVIPNHGGKPSKASRAALLKAIEADFRERAKKNGMTNGKLTLDDGEKLFLELMDEWLKNE
ncbi:MAG: hypothetical protein FWE88_08385 [Phycisphaerae bacterium]|nr:hypothetical protein [Phycisphaerae bacterium]